MSSKDIKRQVKEAYNIVDLVEQENVSLSVSGPGEYKGLCPFHSERTPSFKVSEAFQNYICFGCGETGDIFSFIQKTRGCSFMESLKYLAESKGIKLEDNFSKESDEPKVDLKKMYELLRDTNEFYKAEFKKLDESHPAKKQIIDRGLDVNDEIYGYAPEKYGALYALLKNKGYTEELMLQSELIGEKDGKYFDFFYRRLTVMLADFSGRPVSYSARKLFENDTRAKWVNGKASPIFQKKATLFNLHRAKKEARLRKQIILCEGPFDVLAIEKSGLKNTVASCGTAFTEAHLKSARQLVGPDGELLFAFDGDEAGIEAALKIFLHFPVAHSISKVAIFPEGKDPCDYLIESGPESVNKVITSAKPISDFVLNQLTKEINLTDMDSRYKFVKLLVSKYLIVVKDNILLDYMIRKASIMSGIEKEKIVNLFNEAKQSTPQRLVAQTAEQEKEKLNLKIELNSLDESDLCYVKGLSILISQPLLVAPEMKNFKIPDKFKSFLREFKQILNNEINNNLPYRFIIEEYDDSDFAKLLQKTSQKLMNYTDDLEVVNHFNTVMSHGQKFYEQQEKQKELSNIASALSEAKTTEEIIELLKLRDELK